MKAFITLTLAALVASTPAAALEVKPATEMPVTSAGGPVVSALSGRPITTGPVVIERDGQRDRAGDPDRAEKSKDHGERENNHDY